MNNAGYANGDDGVSFHFWAIDYLLAKETQLHPQKVKIDRVEQLSE